MKRKTLTLIMFFVATVAFAQVPKHLRVLNYVPDSCYSVAVVNLDTLARVFELEAMHRENFLKPLYDSVKFSKKLVQSWIKKDSKLGVDFTATAAFVDSRYFLLPLNNEKNFEKMIRTLEKSLPPFKDMTDDAGRKIRCMLVDEDNLSMAVICTDDVACLVLLNDMKAIYSGPVFNSTIPDTNDINLLVDSFYNNKETPMQVWNRISRSKFASSELAATLLAKGWDAYTAYRSSSPFVQALVSLMDQYFPSSVDFQNFFNNLDVEIFMKGEAHHDRLTSVTEFHQHNQHSVMGKLRHAPEEVSKLLPYVPGDYQVLLSSSVVGYGDLATPYLTKYPQWSALCPLLNKPFVFTLSLSETGYQGQAVTLVDHPEEVRGVLERYVAASNHITDSVRKNVPVVGVVEEPLEEPFIKVEEIPEEPEAQPENEEPVEYKENYVELMDQFIDAEIPEDSTINMKTLVCKKIDGWDVYIILTNKKEMDYETFTQIVKEDSSCVLVKDDLLFFTKSLNVIPSLSQPVEREWQKENFEHPFFARIDFGTFVTLFGPDSAIPLRDMTCSVEGNTFTMNVNAVPGLHHGIVYEIVKFAIDIIQQFDIP